MGLYSVAIQQVSKVVQPILNVATDVSNSTLVATINSTLEQFSTNAGYNNGYDPPIPETINKTLADLFSGNATDAEAEDLTTAIASYVFQSYGYDSVDPNDSESINEFFNTISTAYLYFFISAGGALLALAVLLWIGKRHKSAAEYSSIVVRLAIGAALCLSTLMYLPSQQNNFGNFVDSGWTLPMVMLSLGLGKGIFRSYISSL